MPGNNELTTHQNMNIPAAETIEMEGYEKVVALRDPATGYRGIIAIHSTKFGPAVGGTRFWNYQSDKEALADVLRLARGMTYKNAAAGLPLGGGKAVILGDARQLDRAAWFRAHGRFVESFQGRFITGEDVGTSPADMQVAAQETRFVAGFAGRGGDPFVEQTTAPASTPVPSRDYITARLTELRKIHTPEGIESLEEVTISGTRQWVSIRGLNRANPVLLFIHGGPGTPMMPLTWAYQAPWEDFFTVVQWDQRGVGKNAVTADREALKPTMTTERIIADAEELTAWLRPYHRDDGAQRSAHAL